MTQHQGKGPYHVEINDKDGFVRISRDSREMLYWDHTEWQETPDLLLTILEAVCIALTDPPRMTLTLIGMGRIT